MSRLFISSTGNQAGQSLITWAIARRLTEKGLGVGFMKPFGVPSFHRDGRGGIDQDVSLLKPLLNLQEPYEKICPFMTSERDLARTHQEEIIRKLESLAQDLSGGRDILLIMGSAHIFMNDSSGPIADAALISALGADFLLIHRYEKTSTALYSILSVGSLLKARMKGIIFNRIQPQILRDVKEQVIPGLLKREIPIIAAIPEDPSLSFRNLGDIRNVLHGEILFGKDCLDRPVGGMTVGSGDLPKELSLFKKVYNKIILLKPSSSEDKTEGPSLRRPVAGILLTAGRAPAEGVLDAAQKTRTPLFLVKEDTFAVLNRLEKTSPTLSIHDENKVIRITELMDDEGALDRFLQSLKPIA